jgi:hypothetical protein
MTTTETPVFERTETTLNGRFSGRYGDHISAVGNARLIFTERSDPQNFAGLVDRALLDPWRFESDALFVEFIDMGLDGFDLRIGRQQIIWGTADRFHPTSNLNAYDFEDPLKFGEAIGNEMVTLRWRPDAQVGDEDEPWLSEFNMELVFVPVFKPAQLPNSAGVAFTDSDEMARQAKSPKLLGLLAEQAKLAAQGWTFAYAPSISLPEHDAGNSMYGARLGFRLLGVDLSFSYFRGFDDMPRVEKVTTVATGTDVSSNVHLTYPRVQVLGVDMATSLDWLGGLGLWTEVGITFHDDLHQIIDTGPIEGVVLEKELEAGYFVKAVVGMDYTITPWWYVNVQYLRGFVDEFGKGRMGDYIVAGMDFKIARDIVLFRMFGIVNLSDGSFVAFPQISVKPWNNGELTLGAFMFFGDKDTKFGSKVAGESTVFLKGTVLF